MEGKSKTIAVVLAVLLSPAAWLYTYREDSAKFWAWACILVVAVVLALAAPALSVITSLMGLAFWIWTIVGVARRPSAWYTHYNSGETAERDVRRAA